MAEITMTKKCGRCATPIPDEYVNLLCLECYNIVEEEGKKQNNAVEEVKKQELTKDPNAATKDVEPNKPTFGITEPNYKENPEQEDKDQVFANMAQFAASGKMLWYPTRNIYNYIRDYCIQKTVRHPQYEGGKFVWKPRIVDVGCGCGVGTNVMSNEADFTWGIDKNAQSIRFCKECFTRDKNGIYYNAEVKFDQFDIMEDTRETMKFELVVAVEIIEHIYDTDKFIKKLIQLFAKKNKNGTWNTDDATEFFFSTPNRDNPKIQNHTPQNLFHVREWSKKEFEEMLLGYFERVELTGSTGEPLKDQETPMLAKCSLPK